MDLEILVQSIDRETYTELKPELDKILLEKLRRRIDEIIKTPNYVDDDFEEVCELAKKFDPNHSWELLKEHSLDALLLMAHASNDKAQKKEREQKEEELKQYLLKDQNLNKIEPNLKIFEEESPIRAGITDIYAIKIRKGEEAETVILELKAKNYSLTDTYAQIMAYWGDQSEFDGDTRLIFIAPEIKPQLYFSIKAVLKDRVRFFDYTQSEDEYEFRELKSKDFPKQEKIDWKKVAKNKRQRKQRNKGRIRLVPHSTQSTKKSKAAIEQPKIEQLIQVETSTEQSSTSAVKDKQSIEQLTLEATVEQPPVAEPKKEEPKTTKPEPIEELVTTASATEQPKAEQPKPKLIEGSIIAVPAVEQKPTFLETTAKQKQWNEYDPNNRINLIAFSKDELNKFSEKFEQGWELDREQYERLRYLDNPKDLEQALLNYEQRYPDEEKIKTFGRRVGEYVQEEIRLLDPKKQRKAKKAGIIVNRSKRIITNARQGFWNALDTYVTSNIFFRDKKTNIDSVITLLEKASKEFFACIYSSEFNESFKLLCKYSQEKAVEMYGENSEEVSTVMAVSECLDEGLYEEFMTLKIDRAKELAKISEELTRLYLSYTPYTEKMSKMTYEELCDFLVSRETILVEGKELSDFIRRDSRYYSGLIKSFKPKEEESETQTILFSGEWWEKAKPGDKGYEARKKIWENSSPVQRMRSVVFTSEQNKEISRKFGTQENPKPYKMDRRQYEILRDLESPKDLEAALRKFEKNLQDIIPIDSLHIKADPTVPFKNRYLFERKLKIIEKTKRTINEAVRKTKQSTKQFWRILQMTINPGWDVEAKVKELEDTFKDFSTAYNSQETTEAFKLLLKTLGSENARTMESSLEGRLYNEYMKVKIRRTRELMMVDKNMAISYLAYSPSSLYISHLPFDQLFDLLNSDNPTAKLFGITSELGNALASFVRRDNDQYSTIVDILKPAETEEKESPPEQEPPKPSPAKPYEQPKPAEPQEETDTIDSFVPKKYQIDLSNGQRLKLEELPQRLKETLTQKQIKQLNKNIKQSNWAETLHRAKRRRNGPTDEQFYAFVDDIFLRARRGKVPHPEDISTMYHNICGYS